MTHLEVYCTPNIQRAKHGTKANHYSHDLCCNTPVGTVTCLLIKQIWKQCDQILSQGNSFQKWISAFKLTMWLVIFFQWYSSKERFFLQIHTIFVEFDFFFENIFPSFKYLATLETWRPQSETWVSLDSVITGKSYYI